MAYTLFFILFFDNTQLVSEIELFMLMIFCFFFDDAYCSNKIIKKPCIQVNFPSLKATIKHVRCELIP